MKSQTASSGRSQTPIDERQQHNHSALKTAPVRGDTDYLHLSPHTVPKHVQTKGDHHLTTSD